MPVQSVVTSRFDTVSGDFVSLPMDAFKRALRARMQTEYPGLQLELLANDRVLLAWVDLAQYQPRLLDPGTTPQGELSAELLLDASANSNATGEEQGQWPAQRALLIGSFFVSGFAPLTPLGLLQVNGRTLSPLQPHGYTRILGLHNNGLGVVHRGGFHRGQFVAAVQVGPGIIEAGGLDINPTEVSLPQYLRSFVGVCGQRALLGVTFEPMHLYELGKLLETRLASSDTPALSCDEVVNLSGDRETLLVLPEASGDSLLVYGDPRAPKSALLGFVGARCAVGYDRWPRWEIAKNGPRPRLLDAKGSCNDENIACPFPKAFL